MLPEDAREGQHIVYLVGVIRAAGSHNLCSRGQSLRWHDFGYGIGHGKDDGIFGHAFYHFFIHYSWTRQAYEHIGAFYDIPGTLLISGLEISAISSFPGSVPRAPYIWRPWYRRE